MDLETLVTAQSAALFAYLWRLLRDPADAEDCLQETFLRAHRAHAQLHTHPNPTAWLYRTATNLARTHLRRRQHPVQQAGVFEDTLPAAESPLPEQVAQQQLLAAVSMAVDALPHHQRAALLLRQYQGLDYEAIGLTLNCSATTARAHVYQALKKLRQQFIEEKAA